MAELKLLPRLNARSGNHTRSPVRVSVEDCAISDRDVHVLRNWAGEENFQWDGREKIDCTPSWGTNDSPWMPPDVRETRFWQPEIWEKLMFSPEDETVNYVC